MTAPGTDRISGPGHSFGRRSFLIGAGAGTAVTATGLNAANHRTDGAPVQAGSRVVDFRGANQAGIYRPAVQQAQACFASFKVLVRGRSELKGLLQILTVKGSQLAIGRAAGALPANSGVLGEDVPADSFTMTVGLAGSVFDNPSFGLAHQKPVGLTSMKVFRNDILDPAWTGGDLILQLCADSTDMIHYALRDIARATRGLMQLQWKINGFHSAPRPAGSPRNLFGYKDGIVNPAPEESLVWLTKDSGQPDWAVGGTFLVVRLIRMRVELWDRVGLRKQDNMIGRHRATGAPLGAANETDTPDYANDPKGRIIPLDAHIRLANPRTKDTDRSRFLRRGYNYDLGLDPDGNLHSGLIFAAYQQNIQHQFEATQIRLINEPLTDYVQPFGGGYFIALPGVTSPDGHLGATLFT
ncbi:Dyp-type peroxidase [Arthrobacter sp. MMS18-M83]|uniref:Dyp-type peroxidase n=1 Tax=Arthrobacter sp. MMS18-M83 TaxID=2996261 RepID=UPI00227A2DCD|nr:Dyp-type peroxidase [Arthrobacter sp. MMS18-M83]WAH98128.1 Dyp-type peroxidase [Arthrobacter sp. MMS18-M83]